MRLSIIALLLMSSGNANAGVVTHNGSNLTQDAATAIAQAHDVYKRQVLSPTLPSSIKNS